MDCEGGWSLPVNGTEGTAAGEAEDLGCSHDADNQLTISCVQLRKKHAIACWPKGAKISTRSAKNGGSRLNLVRKGGRSLSLSSSKKGRRDLMVPSHLPNHLYSLSVSRCSPCPRAQEWIGILFLVRIDP